MAPLAGKPPFATDDRDSYYEPPRQIRRPRQPPQDPTRTSAYDVYDSYFGDDTTTNRQSGMGALGLGFMNGSFDDDDDDDEDDFGRRDSMKKSKHDMLAEATRTRNRTPSPPPVYNVTQPIAQPRPGYAAPIAALDKLAKPEPVASPDSRNPGMRINVSPIQSSPSPHSVAPPLSPIQPAFARPRPAPQQTLAFDEKAIMRGESEGDVIPRRGERGDDFWRRFSMVVRENNLQNPKSKESAWLRKTQNGSNRLATWVWIVGVVLILAVAGGIGLGVYTSQKNTSHATPHAFGGSEGEKSGAGISTTMPVVGKGTPTAHTSFHVSPTKTVARREALFATMAAHRRSPRNH